MSLGWMNLQEYLGANQQQADELASRLDAQQRGIDDAAIGAANRGDTMDYNEFLAKRRTAQSMRASESGRAAMLGGDAGDALLASRGASAYKPPTLDTGAEMARKAAERKKAADDYWAQQAERNRGLAASADAERKKQSSDFDAAKRAMTERAGGPGYLEYSKAAEKSYADARGGPRRISQEEWNRWTR